MIMSQSQQQQMQQTIDDTQSLVCTIQATETLNDHVVYSIQVQRRGMNPNDAKNVWKISKRYTEFNELHTELKVANYELAMPPKKAFGNMKAEFLSVRQTGLQDFLDRLVENLLLASSFSVKRFLDPNNYGPQLNFREQALANVSMFFRSEPSWEVVESFNEIGWRFRKQHIMLKNKELSASSSKLKYILTWCGHGPDKILKETELSYIFQQFTQIQHENIEPILRIASGSENSTIIIQQLHDSQISLRDYIYGVSSINKNYLKKYAYTKNPKKIPIELVKQIAKQVLLVLQFIYSKGLFYGHLHSGNILIDPKNNNKIRLTDLTNSLTGLPYFYRAHVIENRKIQNLELVDVYGFGNVLYEMIFGESIMLPTSKNQINVRSMIDQCPFTEFKPLLSMLLIDDQITKNGLPTIAHILEMALFQHINVPASNSGIVKFSSAKSKELLVKAREFIEKRMNHEQQALHKIKKHAKAEGEIFSEKEVRKRRKEKKKAKNDDVNSLEFPTSPRVSSTSQKTTANNSIESRNSNKNDPPSSSTTVASGGPSPPPPPPGPPPPGPPPPPPPQSAPSSRPASKNNDRSGLLTSISGFSKGGLKKAETNDRSSPKL